MMLHSGGNLLKLINLNSRSLDALDDIKMESVRDELDRIVKSETFRQAERQRQLLSCIVEAELRSDREALLGKNLARDFFGIDAESTQEVSTIRVEVARLRRRLHLYYEDESTENPTRIDIPKGSYVPTFVVAGTSAKAPGFPVRRAWAVGATLIVLAGAFVLGLNWRADISAPEEISPRFTESAEAYSMFFESLRISNPPVIKARVDAAMKLAIEIQKIDPSFGGGYAAESMHLWKYVLFGHSDLPQADIDRAITLARMAIETDPEFSWGHHAEGAAYYLGGEQDASLAAFDRAIDLNPDESIHLAAKGLALAGFDKGPEAVEILERAIELDGDNVRHTHLNFLGVAYFHSGRFEEAAEVIQHNRDIGGPTGPHMMIYLASAHALAGNVGRADAAANLLRANGSDFSVGTFMDHLLHDQSQKGLVIDGLSKAGLTTDEIAGLLNQ